MNVIVDIQLKKPPLLSIAVIIKPLEKHFTYRYSSTGAERSPILAVYAVYQRMMERLTRYKGQTLCPPQIA